MKKLVWLVIVGALAYLGYTQFIQPRTAEEAQVRHLEKEFQRATDRYIESMRQAGEPGIVILADPETAEKMVKDLRPKLQELMKKLTNEKAIDRAQKLESQIATFCERNQID
jgi:C4-dicarboxylate-specific signal transduction histidine kinase